MPAHHDTLLKRAQALKLHGLVSRWGECAQSDWVESLVGWEEQERTRRSLERRVRAARIGNFKPLADFDWQWPTQCDQAVISELMALEFIQSAINVILIGASGLGKTTIAQNLAHQAVLHGHTVLFTTAGQILGELAALDSDSALRRRLKHYASPSVLVIDEIGYLSYSNRHADLLFELINRRHEHKSTIITTNKSFAQWSEVFPNAACVVALIDRLIHHAEIISLQGKSYRHKEASERTAAKIANRKKARSQGMLNQQPYEPQTELCLRLDKRWTPAQAMAVFELITDLRDLIWSHYDLTLQEQYQRDPLQDDDLGWKKKPKEKDPDVPF